MSTNWRGRSGCGPRLQRKIRSSPDSAEETQVEHSSLPRQLMSDVNDLFTGGGEVGALMRQHDWSTSPLGFPARWPRSLRTVVALLLQSRFPMFVAWGKDLGFLYNAAYAEILGSKHPAALGRRF